MNIKIISKNNCTECERIKSLMDDKDLSYEEVLMSELSTPEQFEVKNIARRNRQASMPLLFVNEEFVPTSDFEERFLREVIA